MDPERWDNNEDIPAELSTHLMNNKVQVPVENRI